MEPPESRGWGRLRAWWATLPPWVRLVLVGIAVLLLLISAWWAHGYRLPPLGFAEAYLDKPDHLEYRPVKTVWDWLGLLVIPVLLAIAGYVFTHRREELARELETDRLREEALLGYIDRMTELILDRNLSRSA
jgi:hypothetical protein